MDATFPETLFPAFSEIENPDLRQKAEAAMLSAMEQGRWTCENIRTAPVTLSRKDCDVSWVEHVTDVTELCILQYERLSRYYKKHHVPFSRDIVIAGALLHDIGKLTEFVPGKDGSVVHGEGFELMRHPLSGALIASKAGLPDIIVHLIATHSFEGDRSYQTPESEFVRQIDLFVFNCSVKGLEKQ